MPSARYWRIYISACHDPAGVASATEIEMRATSGGADQTSSAYASASSYNTGFGGLTPAKAFDNVTGFYNSWVASSSSLPQWIQQDFGAATTVAEIAYSCFTYQGGPKDFDIQYSDDGSNWTTSKSYTGVTWSSSYQQQIFAASDGPPAVDFDADGISVTPVAGTPALTAEKNVQSNGITFRASVGRPELTSDRQITFAVDCEWLDLSESAVWSAATELVGIWPTTRTQDAVWPSDTAAGAEWQNPEESAEWMADSTESAIWVSFTETAVWRDVA